MEAVGRRRVLSFRRHVADEAAPLAALARRCYPEMAVRVEAAPTTWRVHLAPLAPLAVVHDPGLTAALARLGIDLSDMMGWHRDERIGRAAWLVSLNHAWALVAWAKWLAGGSANRPLLVHVGVRDDLGVPLLACQPEPSQFTGLMEDLTIDLAVPATVALAVEAGVVGSGSYVAPFLRARPADIVHLAPAGSETPPCAMARFTAEAAAAVSDPGVERLVLRPDDQGPCRLERTVSPNGVAAAHRDGQPVLLDIDLGYFELVATRQRARALAGAPVPEFLGALAPLLPAVVVVTVSLSPGTCPAARWRALLDELRLGLQPWLDR
jgi:hypothetical protein